MRLNNPQWTAIYPIDNVPIVIPRAGGFCLTLPIKAGDEGMLVFCDQCIDAWWENGGIQPPPGGPLAQPNFERRRHDISDCGFYPGLWSQPNVISDYSTNSAQLRSDDGDSIVDVAEAGITLTAKVVEINATEGNVNINAEGNVEIQGTNIAINSFNADTSIDDVDFLLHTHSGVSTGSSDTGPVT